MYIYIGADHRGFELKEFLKIFLKNQGYEVADMGNLQYDQKDDYSEFAKNVAQKVSRDYENSRGIIICGSGAGVDITANKFRNVRSVIGFSPDQIYAARHDDDVNVLSLASNFTSQTDAQKIVIVFLETPFSGEERHKRRLELISQIENQWNG